MDWINELRLMDVPVVCACAVIATEEAASASATWDKALDNSRNLVGPRSFTVMVNELPKCFKLICDACTMFTEVQIYQLNQPLSGGAAR